jgi:hypothetical protein
MHPSCCPVRKVPLFNEGDLDAAHRKVARDAAAGRSPADNDDVWFATHPFGSPLNYNDFSLPPYHAGVGGRFSGVV